LVYYESFDDVNKAIAGEATKALEQNKKVSD